MATECNNLAAIRDWVGWAQECAEMGVALRFPRDVAAETSLYRDVAFCPTCKTAHPSAPCQNREETPAP